MRKKSEWPNWPAAPVTATRRGGLDIQGLRQAVPFILPQRDAAPRRYNRFSPAVARGSNVQRGREKTTTEVPQPLRDPVPDPAAAAGLGVDPAPGVRGAAGVSLRRLGALSPRRELTFRARFFPHPGVPGHAAREAGTRGVPVGRLPSLLRRHPLPRARSQQGHRTAGGARFERRGDRRERAPHRLLRRQAMVNRVIVGAHYGTRDWLAQRVTAAIMAVYVVVVLALVATRAPFTYETWKALFAQGGMRVATLLFALSLAWHAWVGVRDILMDYVKHDGLRLALQVLTVLLVAGYASWTIEILWR